MVPPLLGLDREMPRVSVILPCYNQGQFLDEAVDSVLAQTFRDTEIVIVNDGSTDKYTVRKLHSYRGTQAKVIHTENRGLAAARNTGIAAAVGEYILPLDADDKIGARYVEKAVDILDNDLGCGIVYCEAELFGKKRGKWAKPPYSLEKMLLDNLIFATAFFRKTDWELTGGFKTNMSAGWEDWDFWLGLVELGRKVYKIPEILFYYRIHEHSMRTQLKKAEYIELHAQLFRNHQQLYADNIASLFKEFYNLRLSRFAKFGRIIRNPWRVYEKLFKI
jgi:glycosyltransferase involved in cell wall biosynthesis